MEKNHNHHEVHPVTYIFVVGLLLLTLVGISPLFNQTSRDFRSRAQLAHSTRTPTPLVPCTYSSYSTCLNSTSCNQVTHRCSITRCGLNSNGVPRAACVPRGSTGGGNTCSQSTCRSGELMKGQIDSYCRIDDGKSRIYGCTLVTGLDGCPNWYREVLKEDCSLNNGSNSCGTSGRNAYCYQYCNFDSCTVGSQRCGRDGLAIMRCDRYSCGGNTGSRWVEVANCGHRGESCTCGTGYDCNGLTYDEMCNPT